MNTENKRTKYEYTLTQVRALLEKELRPLPCMSNICALLKENFGFFWVGFYIVDGNELVLGPFQGPVACMTISKGRGVCGTSWEKKEAIVVPDVEEFPGHIACNPLSRSEIVVPVKWNNEVVAVLDIDSEVEDKFDSIDLHYLQQIVGLPFAAHIGELTGVSY